MAEDAPYKLLLAQKELDAWVAQAPQTGRVALDMEFIRRSTYYPKLCLVQLATEAGEITLIDPLDKELDLTSLWQWLQETTCTIVLHAALQDLQIMYTACHKLPASVWDTQIAAALLGEAPQASLAHVTEHYLGITLDKSQQEAAWQTRPLEEEALSYAASDVRHLLELADALDAALQEKQRQNWAEEEMQKLQNAALYIDDVDAEWQRWQPKREGIYNQAVFTLLYARQELAEMHDLPRKWVIRNEVIQSVAEALEAGEEIKPRGLSKRRPIAKALAEKLSECDDCVPDAYGAPETTRPNKKWLQQARNLLHEVADTTQLAPELIATTKQLQHLVVCRMKNEPPSGPPMQGWRYEVFGTHWENIIQDSTNST